MKACPGRSRRATIPNALTTLDLTDFLNISGLKKLNYMTSQSIEIMHTTLRNGEQTSGISFSALEKLYILALNLVDGLTQK